MTLNNIKIAITGGIGSGKTTVSKIIAEDGLPVFSCDKIYTELLKDKNFIALLSREFEDILFEDGSLNRRKLSEIVFNDAKQLNKLNTITHPAILNEAFKRMERYALSFCEVPLLFEEGLEKLFNGVIVVLRDREQRIKSIVKRDGIAKEQAVLRLNAQYDYDKNKFTEYYVIHNKGNLGDLRQKTLQVLDKIKGKAL